MDHLTVTLMLCRSELRGPWECNWALLDDMHEDPIESGLVLAPSSMPGLEALRIALSAAWRAAKHLHV